ncbi:MAG: hypothetical protein QHC40_09920 [Sphingobium sp.]|nr:hypothetical protein [Sphingobium sp.]
MTFPLRRLAVTLSLLALATPALADAPRLVRQGKPMLLIAGELGNSSASSAAYMAPHWQRLRNGDQTHQGRHIQLAPGKFQIQKVKLYRYG